MSDSILAAAGDSSAPRPSGGKWRKSSFSAANGDCVEVATLAEGQVGVRDSKAIAGPHPHLRFSPNAWTAFVGGIRRTPATARRDLIP